MTASVWGSFIFLDADFAASLIMSNYWFFKKLCSDLLGKIHLEVIFLGVSFIFLSSLSVRAKRSAASLCLPSDTATRSPRSAASWTPPPPQRPPLRRTASGPAELSDMSGREVREYTNLSDPKDRKYGKGKDKIDDEDVTFQRMVAKGFWLSTGRLMPTDAGCCW